MKGVLTCAFDAVVEALQHPGVQQLIGDLKNNPDKGVEITRQAMSDSVMVRHVRTLHQNGLLGVQSGVK